MNLERMVCCGSANLKVWITQPSSNYVEHKKTLNKAQNHQQSITHIEIAKDIRL